jgi:hypothetical protein
MGVSVGGMGVLVGAEVGVNVLPSAALAAATGWLAGGTNANSTAIIKGTMPTAINNLLVIIITSQSGLS